MVFLSQMRCRSTARGHEDGWQTGRVVDAMRWHYHNVMVPRCKIGQRARLELINHMKLLTWLPRNSEVSIADNTPFHVMPKMDTGAPLFQRPRARKDLK